MIDLQLPTWLVDIWSVYGGVITPIFTTVLTILGSVLALAAKKKGVQSNQQAEAVLVLLQKIASGDNAEVVAKVNECETKANANGEKITQMSDIIAGLMQVFVLAFNNSDLDPEVKEQMENIINTLKYGSTDQIVAELNAQIDELKAQLDDLSKKIEEENPTVEVATETETETPVEPTAVRL